MKYNQYNNSSNYIWLGLILFILMGGSKLIFAIFGLIVGLTGFVLAFIIQFLPLIFIGSVIYFITKSIRKNHSVHSYLDTHSQAHQRFVTLLIHFSTHIIHADGKVDDREIQMIHQFFKQSMSFNSIQMTWVDDILQQALKNPYPINILCREFLEKFKIDGIRMLIHMLYLIAKSDGTITKIEQDLIDQIASSLQLSESDHQQIRAMFGLSKQSKMDDYYAVLGISKNATKEEIKKAYRNASKKHHPDRVHHLGDEFKKIAEQKMQKINEAYAALNG